MANLLRKTLRRAAAIAGGGAESGGRVAGSDADDRGQLHESGFHGDAHLLSLLDRVLPDMTAYIETGANLGSTVRYVATRYPSLEVHACEPDAEAATRAEAHVFGLENAMIYDEPSPEFLYRLHETHPHFDASLNAYFLDAHGHGFEWPLAKELAFVTRLPHGVVIVDDCQVPGRPMFKYSAYAGQTCTLDYIRRAAQPRDDYTLVVPDYTDRTSPHHPLTGYALLAFGTPVLRLAAEGDERFRTLPLEAAASTTPAA